MKHIVQLAAIYEPEIPPVPEDKIEERIRYSGKWVGDQIKGFTVEESSGFKYVGMYENDLRNGYGEEFLEG